MPPACFLPGFLPRFRLIRTSLWIADPAHNRAQPRQPDRPRKHPTAPDDRGNNHILPAKQLADVTILKGLQLNNLRHTPEQTTVPTDHLTARGVLLRMRLPLAAPDFAPYDTEFDLN